MGKGGNNRFLSKHKEQNSNNKTFRGENENAKTLGGKVWY